MTASLLGLEFFFGYREGRLPQGSTIAYCRRMVELGRARVDEQARRGWQGGLLAAQGLLAAYEDALRVAERAALWADWAWLG